MGVERRHERISIHAPRMGSDSAGRWVDITTIPFQSTLPGWGATHEATMYPLDSTAFQSTLPGWGATIAPAGLPHPCEISIHAPRMGSDMVSANPTDKELKFQSTLPGWGATRSWNTQTRNISISIHAPRMGSDVSPIACKPPISNFNPRSPDGERQYDSNGVSRKSLFQSTLPGWGATKMLEIK